MFTQQLEGEIYIGSDQYQTRVSGKFQPRLIPDEGPRLYENKVRIPFRNHYFIWRHGESEANTANIIVSKPENGTDNFGLTEAGIRQVRRQATITHLLSRGVVGPDGLIYSSPFLRCVQTAEEIAQVIGVPEITTADELRERDFGRFEGKNEEFYQAVYQLDKFCPGHKFFGVENTDEVSARVTGLVKDLEEQYQRRVIILVTHADVGEILLATFLGLNSWEHRRLHKLRNAEWRDFQTKFLKEGEK